MRFSKLPKFSTPPGLRALALKAYLKRLSLDDKPILVGPWRSELGFEVLYWVPFLHWVAERVPGFWSRAVVVTRGGANAWYPAKQSVDLYTLRTLEQFRVENNNDQLATGLQKQMRCTTWDSAVIDEAFVSVKFPGAAAWANQRARYHVLHPSWMYWTLEPFWEEQRALAYVTSMLRFPKIQTPELPAGLTLPEKFVAVKVYNRATFPDNPMTRDFVKNLVARITKQMPVVLLHQPSLHADDHHDIPVGGPNVFQLPAFPVERNLEYISAVLGRATSYIGTYGGVAQLALRMGVPSVSFYNQFAGTARAHLTLSQTLANNIHKVPFVALGIGDVGLCKLALREYVPQVIAPEVVSA